MRRILFLILIIFGGLFVISNFTQLESVSGAMLQANWQVLAVSFIFVFIWLINQAALYRAIYRSLGVEESIVNLFIVALASMFVNVVTPGGLLGGVALFVDRASKQGYSVAKATLTGLLQLVFDLMAFASVLVVGLIILFRRNDLTAATISASIIMFAIAGLLLFLFVLGIQSAEKLSIALAKLTRAINKLLHPLLKRDYLSIENAVSRGREAANGLKSIRGSPKHLVWPYLLALNGKAIQIIIFWLMFVAFQVSYSAGMIIAGFCISFLFMVVSPTPIGLGVVETILPITLKAMFVPLDAAIVITLSYRGMIFWVPMFLGMLSLRFVNFKSKQKISPALD